MKTTENSPIKIQLKVINIIFFALLSSMILFLAVVLIIIQDKRFSEGSELDKVFTFFVPVFGLLMMFLSRTIYNRMISKVDRSSNLFQKINHFRTSKIVSWALVEGACLLALVATMLTSNYLYIVVFVFLFGYLIMIKPSKESLVRDMRLNSEESDLILKR